MHILQVNQAVQASCVDATGEASDSHLERGELVMLEKHNTNKCDPN